MLSSYCDQITYGYYQRKSSFCNCIHFIVSLQCACHVLCQNLILSKYENVSFSAFSSECNLLPTEWFQRETLQPAYVCVYRAGIFIVLEKNEKLFQSYDVENYVFHLSRLGLNGLNDDEDTVQMIIESKSVNMGLPMIFECSYYRFLVCSEFYFTNEISMTKSHRKV